ncbi:hypothetical protein ACCAA_190026 [Candidatus Accumulibacter aalborgensis]|uniref:Uncharacterized protein n=1 Tax=Candidatus Accumulibacter aalborgensis TaxID=1860102 RepID=A0A1A8XLN0_9PROT|nr:hypothetical protein ACCAA_190026 [Candidatus Accumulibacter aalborgensis]
MTRFVLGASTGLHFSWLSVLIEFHPSDFDLATMPRSNDFHAPWPVVAEIAVVRSVGVSVVRGVRLVRVPLGAPSRAGSR